MAQKTWVTIPSFVGRVAELTLAINAALSGKRVLKAKLAEAIEGTARVAEKELTTVIQVPATTVGSNLHAVLVELPDGSYWRDAQRVLGKPGSIFALPESKGVDGSAIGLQPSDIDYLLCTHLDDDHSGNHELFTSAEFVIQQQHYELAKGGHSRFAANRAVWDHPSLRYRLIEGDIELVPGVELLETSGHVPGHQSVLVHLPLTGGILLAADAVMHHSMADAWIFVVVALTLLQARYMMFEAGLHERLRTTHWPESLIHTDNKLQTASRRCSAQLG